jgi:epsilon-lactone hydrolase
MTAGPQPVLHVPAQDIPVPTSISEQAQAMLAMGPVGPGPGVEWPAQDDLDGWRAVIAERNEATLKMAAGSGSDTGVEVEEITVDGAHVYVITPDGVAHDDRRVYLEVHGGAFIQEGGEICRRRGIDNVRLVGARSWAVDYRMPPDHPYPTPLDDCVAAYRALLQQYRPEDIVIGGPSAGANLAAATILRARDEGLPLPAGAMLFSPVSDLTESGDTWNTNLGLDTVLTARATAVLHLYAAGHDLRDPYLSPVFGDFGKGFPPTLLITGTRDVLLSDTVRLHRALLAADVPADLHVFEAAGHGGFLGMAPEDQERAEQIRRFADECWQAGAL